MKLDQLVKKYETLALENNKESEAVKWLIMELSGFSNTEFYLNLKKEIDLTFINNIDEKVKDYIFNNTPVQHILGFSYFYGYKFNVNEDVLIPRRETEELVEEVLMMYDEYFKNQEVELLDLGTGSGCIAVTLSLEEKNLNVDAADVSELAIKVAKSNNDKLSANVNFLVSDWFSNITKRYDILIANPPYIPDDEVIEEIVRKEPSLALFGGKTGINPYEIILSQARNYLKDKFFIGFEHGYNQTEMINEIAKKYFKDSKIINKKDMQGLDRMTFIVNIGE